MTTRRLMSAVVLVIIGVVGMTSPAGAGGWAVTTLDHVPSPTQGATAEVGFVIRQHGVHPVDPMEGVAIELTLPDGEVQRFEAVHDGEPGHFVAEVTFPEVASVRWSIVQGWFGTQDLGSVELAEHAVGSASRLPLALGAGLAVTLAGWALSLVPQRRRQLAPA